MHGEEDRLVIKSLDAQKKTNSHLVRTAKRDGGSVAERVKGI